ncbi:YqcI/YcgG family protein [Streptomyces caelestis]|uniref:YqcI/YcgG family protein n=1 Tax=Streptomyces caelestis TaxID=36816 RepID=UPI0036FF662F
MLDQLTGPATSLRPGGNVQAMQPVVEGTACPFAAKARLRSAPDFDPARSLAQNVADSVPLLVDFSARAEGEGLDGFVYRFPAERVGSTVEDLGRLLRVLLQTLARHDPQEPRELDKDTVLAPGWRFSFAGLDYFVPVFAPVYGKHHSRHTYGLTEDVFVLMQPNSSFHTRLGARRDLVLRNIRSRFAEAGQSYPVHGVEAHKFVLPPAVDDEPVPWYDGQPLGNVPAQGRH